MSEPESPDVIRRHTLATRLWHWTTAVSVIILLGSGLMILNAHGQLYWGEYGANFDQPWFKLIWFFDTARVPGWLTIPSSYNLALARRWHLFFALVLGFALLAYIFRGQIEALTGVNPVTALEITLGNFGLNVDLSPD
ncbi:MAG: hypothetical protein B7Y97_09930 [Sphingomonas sp. 32-66-10]|nr:MAG: hypothetical protein B7Y97_09930 [Sphingomonas sp. 32-66-10]